MIKAKTFKCADGYYVVKRRFLLFWWRAVEVEVGIVRNKQSIATKYSIRYTCEYNAPKFSSEYAASFYLAEVKSLVE